MTNLLRTAATALALATTATIATAGAAAACQGGTSNSTITARPSDDRISSGEQIVLRGRMTSHGEPVSGSPVQVRTWVGDGWQAVPGAQVTTDDEGRYRVRLVLQATGLRDVQVVADPAGDRIDTARALTAIRVTR